MNFSKKNHERVGQNAPLVKKPQKHDANLQKNSTLYFQVGLILTLLVTYALFEMQFERTVISINDYAILNDPDETIIIEPFKVFEEPVKQEALEVLKKKVILNQPPKIVPDDFDQGKELFEIITPEQNTSGKVLTPEDVNVYIPEEVIDIIGVEQVPIYPGCEGLSTNTKRRKCMSDKIGKLISRKFNSDIASGLGLHGKQRIDVQFKIDKTGYVTEIKARAPHDKLEREAIKVIHKIPQMIPGKQRNINVAVIYRLPIVLQVQ
ncbi:MAG: energy transducer TonB [Chlorobi bacterium]|nr:energy transducer TonB [Chlorobiota bacterium]